jgi:hypothetical protein
MFTIDCPQHGTHVLVGTRRIRAFHNTDHGIFMSVECYCGSRVAVPTGRRYTKSGSGLGRSLVAVA